MKSSPNCKKEFIFGSYLYYYDLLFEDRKTLSLTVMPDLQIKLKCPYNTEQERIDTFLHRKWFWLEKQLNFFRKYQRKKYKREYISGEGFLYLGKQYKLQVLCNNKDDVLLKKGTLLVYTTKGVQNGLHTRKLLDAWYSTKTDKVFLERFTELIPLFNYKQTPALKVKKMDKRWGSYLQSGTVVLNPNLILSSKDCIDYVIIHELCHVRYKNHDKRFYSLLNAKMPMWKKIKDKLEIIGADMNA